MFGPNFRGFVSENQSQLSQILKKSDSGDSGHCSEDEEEQSTNRAIELEFQLTQSLLSQVKADENSADANSGKQAYIDLPRMNFIINGKTISKDFVSQLCDRYNQELQSNKRQVAKHVLIEMFKHAEAEVPDDHILKELITNCNQAGYDGSLLMQLFPIFCKHNLQLPDANDRKINIICNSQDSLNIQYCPNMPVKKLDTNMEICKLDAILEFALKSQNGKVEYEEGKVTLTIPEQLKNYQAEDKSLLDDINEYFKDADNAVVESLIANIGEGPKSFVAEDSSSIIIEGNDTSAQALDNTGEEVTDPGLIVGAISGLVGVAELVVDMTKEVLFPQDQNNIKPSCDDEEFSIIENDTLDKVVNILNKAINGNDYKELDKVISGDKNSTFIIDRSEKFEDFCSQQLKLTAQTDHHKRVRDEICNKENGKCVYSIKKLSLLAIAANDMLVEKYSKKDKDDILFRQDEDLDRLLIGAGGQGYIKALLEFLEEKQSRALSWNNRCQKLKRASFVGNQECVKAILKKFGGAELKSEFGVSSKLLHYAIEQGENDVADVLLSCEELDINSIDDRGYTPLHSAIISKSDSERIRLVLNKGVNVDIKCRRAGKTALHWAALHGCLEKVKLFVEKGAGWNIVDSDGKTALDLASKNDKSEVVGFLKDLDGKTPLYYAVLKNRPDVVEKLVLEGADINGIVRYGTERLKVGYPCVKHTPVTRAILDHRSELVKRLLTSKTDVNTGILGCYGVHYLFLAVKESEKFKGGVQWEIVNLILKHASDISTPELQKAVSTQDYAEVVGLLQGIKSNRHDSNLVNGTAASSQAVNGEDNNRSQNPAPKNQQPQENVNRRENIMNNEEASIEEPISNNYEVSEMRGSPSKKTPSSTKSQQRGKLLNYILQNNVEQVKGLFNQPIEEGAGVFELLGHIMPKIESIQGLSSGNHKRRKKIIEHFIEIVDQVLPPKDCKEQKEEIMERLKGTLEKLSDVSDKSKTPEVLLVNQETGINDGQSNNLSNVDRGKNIINNESKRASKEKSISNSFEEGEMTKRRGKPLAAFVQQKIGKIISEGNDNLEEEFKNILTFDNRDSVLKYAKSQEGPFKDKVVAFLTLQKNKKNGAQINGKQSTNPHNGSVTEPFVQSAPSKNASSGVSNVPKTEDVTNSKDMPVINGASSGNDCEFENDEDVTGNSDDSSSSQRSDGSENDNNYQEDSVPTDQLTGSAEQGGTLEEEDIINPSEVPVISKMPSIATKEAKVNDEQSDNINGDGLTPVSSLVSEDSFQLEGDQDTQPPSPQSPMSGGDVADDKRGDSPSSSGSSSPIQDIVNEEEPVVITTRQPNDSEHDKTMSKEHQDDALEKDLIDFSSDDGNGLLEDQVLTSAPPVTSENSATLNSPQPPVANNKPEQVNDTQPNDGQLDNQNNTALLVQPTTPKVATTPYTSSDISDESETEDVTDGMSVVSEESNENDFEDGYSSDDSNVSVLTVKEIVKGNGNENGRQPDNQNNTALPVQSTTPKMPNAFSDVGGESKTTEPVVTATNSDDKHSEVSSITSNDPLTEDDEKEPLLNGKGNSRQLSDPGKNNTAPQNTQKSKLSTVAICTFAVAGILAGAAAPAAYFAFSVSLLTTEIIAGVAACCLVAAAVIYCCTPKSSVENSNAANVVSQTTGLIAN